MRSDSRGVMIHDRKGGFALAPVVPAGRDPDTQRHGWHCPHRAGQLERGDIAGYSLAGAATLVGVLALFNGGGRIFWAWISGKTGRMAAFGLLIIPHASNAVLFFILAAIDYLCYGGGFGTMPATAGDFFGVKHAGAIYGLMIVGWSLGGLTGPPLIAALIGPDEGYTRGYTVIGIIALVALVLPMVTKMPRPKVDPPKVMPLDATGEAGDHVVK